MKKIQFFALALSLVLLAAAGLAETLNVFNWGDYIDTDTIRQFEEETGIDVVYQLYETNEDMYAKMKSSSFDVIFPSDYMVERLIREKRVQPINWDNIPNVKNIDPRFLNRSYDPDSAYSVPYTWGTMGILYNTTMVDEAPTSWQTLMNPAYTMDMLMLNSPRDTRSEEHTSELQSRI